MNTPFFIARRLSDRGTSSFTRVIVRLGITAVAVSLCVLLLTSALVAGFQNEISQKVFNFWGHIHITHVDSDRSIDAIPIDKRLPSIDKIAGLDRIEYIENGAAVAHTVGGVDRMDPFIHYPGILSTKDAFEGVICKGIDESFDWSFMESYMMDGVVFDTIADPYHNQCIISSIQAARLDVSTGDAMLLNFIIDGSQIRKRVEVTGIYDTGLEEYDSKFVLVDMKLLQNVLQWESYQVSGMAVFLDDLDDINPINEHIYLDLLPPELYSESIATKFPGIFDWLDLQQVNEQVLLVIMLIVAFFNLSTVMIILILDRSRMVATLKSLGARTSSVMKIFIYIVGGIVLKGFAIGNIIALSLAVLQDRFHFIKLNQADYYLSYAPVDFDPVKIAIINVFAFIVILLFMIIPALVVAGIKPVKTLRFG